MNQRILIAQTNKLTKLEDEDNGQTVGGLAPSTDVQQVQEPELTFKESEHEVKNLVFSLSDLYK